MMLIRGTCLTGFRGLVRDLGFDPDRLLADAGIDRAAIGDYDEFVPYLPFLELLETAAAETGAPDFGRRLASRQGIDVLGSVGAAARSAPTVAAALTTVERYLRAYTPSLMTRIAPDLDPGLARFEFQRTSAELGAPYRQGIELALGVSRQAFLLLVGRDWVPSQVHVPHAPLNDPSSYQEYFGGPVEFGSRRIGFTVRSDDLGRPLSSDAATRDTHGTHLRAVTPFRRQGMVPQVDDLVRRLLPGGSVELVVVAEQLGMHPRTLQRRLEEEEVTFGEVVQSVRRRTAEGYLRDTDMPLRHLACELGYLEQSALTRASHRWFGMSPMSYRRRVRTAD
ncbi:MULTISPECIES: AraC family transcriptional regulator [unclassified Nocardioides]|uniref:AraC family transcriptional regulator n=1 Tax=unclassified Nocardioides TaxID=2615069 RepID=UPI0009EF98BF|nr:MULTISPECIES: AraC family transcriptional regulator [unclassified Nocardioides]GAW47727.1 Transcriptional regulatory protein (Probably Ara C /XylS-family) [Nocardioides sp. PD653-B2]GAW56227.1 Transcriptional regulatory protein (Probably Ara C /XylS-family) [Nocardioides sp. PD653]